MSVTEDLQNIRWLSLELSRLREQLQIQTEQGGYRGPVLRNCPSYGSSAGDAIGAYVARTEALRTDVQRRAADLEARIQAVRSALDALECVQRLILELRYIDALEWPAVALAMGKGTSWCHDKHREALAMLEQQKKAPA